MVAVPCNRADGNRFYCRIKDTESNGDYSHKRGQVEVFNCQKQVKIILMRDEVGVKAKKG